MIDFGKTVPIPDGRVIDHRTPYERGNHEDGYLTGLDSLIEAWETLEMTPSSRNSPLRSDDDDRCSLSSSQARSDDSGSRFPSFTSVGVGGHTSSIQEGTSSTSIFEEEDDSAAPAKGKQRRSKPPKSGPARWPGKRRSSQLGAGRSSLSASAAAANEFTANESTLKETSVSDYIPEESSGCGQRRNGKFFVAPKETAVTKTRHLEKRI